jgi:hypothetical protein
VTTDWQAWHGDYADPSSPLSRRLTVVQGHIRRWLDATAPADVTVTSVCAGDGRDLLDVLGSRTDAGRVSCLLVELDPDLANRADAAARAAGLDDVEVRCADAGSTDAYLGHGPAGLVLLCGVLGNVSDADAFGTVDALPALCAAGATVVWTRHRREPDLTPALRQRFATAGFAEESFTAPEDAHWSVGVHRIARAPLQLQPGQRLFAFVR